MAQHGAVAILSLLLISTSALANGSPDGTPPDNAASLRSSDGRTSLATSGGVASAQIVSGRWTSDAARNDTTRSGDIIASTPDSTHGCDAPSAAQPAAPDCRLVITDLH